MTDTLPTYTTAADQMYAIINDAWQAGAGAFNDGVIPSIRWPYEFEAKAAKVTDLWARVSRQTVREKQLTLQDGVKKYQSNGLLFVQIFAPLTDNRAGARLMGLAILVRDAFRGQTTEGSIFFRNARIQELPNDAKSYQIKVVTDYQYDELGA